MTDGNPDSNWCNCSQCTHDLRGSGLAISANFSSAKIFDTTMSATWFLVLLALLQAGVAISLALDMKPFLGGVYVCYGIANILTIWVAKGP